MIILNILVIIIISLIISAIFVGVIPYLFYWIIRSIICLIYFLYNITYRKLISIEIMVLCFISLIINIISMFSSPYDVVIIFIMLFELCLAIDSFLCIGVIKIKHFLRKSSIFIIISFFCFLYFNLITKEALKEYNGYKILFVSLMLFLLLKLSISYVRKRIHARYNYEILKYNMISSVDGNLLFLENLGLGSLIVILLFPTIEHFNWLDLYKSNINVNIFQAVIVVSFSLVLSLLINGISEYWVNEIYYSKAIHHIISKYFTKNYIPLIILLFLIVSASIMMIFSPNRMVSRQIKDYTWNIYANAYGHKFVLKNVKLRGDKIHLRHRRYKKLNKLNKCKIKFNLRKKRLIIISNSHVPLINNKEGTFKLYKFTNNSHYYFKSHNNIKFKILPKKSALIHKNNVKVVLK